MKQYKLTEGTELLKLNNGDIMNNFEIHNMDCMNFEFPQSRFLFADIPYSKVSRESNGLRNLDKGKADIITFDIQMFLEKIFPTSDVFCIFCASEQYSEIFNWFNQQQGTVRPFMWTKSNPSPMNGQYILLGGVETAVWFKKKGTGKLEEKCKKNYFTTSTGSSKFHPTEKNHNLLQYLIETCTKPGDLIVDPCMGSGSTGIVANKLGRNFVGIELDQEYFEIAKMRLSENEKK
jgi:hypothetical protein